MRAHNALFALTLIPLLATAACSDKDHDHDHSGDHSDDTGVTEDSGLTEDGAYMVTWDLVGDAMVVGETFELMIRVYDAADTGMATPLTEGLTVTVDARMEGHGHGMPDGTTPEVMVMGDHFHVTGMVFQMEGQWTLIVTVNGQESRIPITCCE